jgi:hypothetical protein
LGLAVSNKLLDTGFDELFTNLGWDAKLPSYKRTTPWVIRMSPRTVVESYLVGLQDGIFFDADFKSCLAASKCEHFIVETQLLYLNLGVITLKEKVGGYYTLHKQLTGDAIYFDPVTLIEHSKTHCIDLSVPEHEQYVAQGMINHNSTLASLIATYEFYALTKLEQPQAMYGIANSTPIGILVLATTAEQAKKTIFRQVLGILKNSKYFQRLEETGKLFIGKEEVAMESKNLYLYSGNSRSAGQVGGTLKCLIMDEVARFSDIDGDSNALTLWSNLGISCAPFKETAKLIAISSAWCEGDAIQTLFDRAMSGTNSFALKAKSWELNPIHAARDNPVVASFYETNPVEAAVEFEGIRPASSDPFLTASEISKAFNTKSVIHAKKVLNDVTGLVELEIIHFPYVGTPCYLHIDPAITKDSYALAFAHGEDIDGKLVVLVDGILAWEPDYKHSVSITNVQTLIKEINLRMPIEKVTADHYNSAETLERLRLEGIKAEQVYFSNREQILMYDNLRQLLHEERIKFPKDSPWSAMLERELKQVQLINGRKIDHPAKGSKDLADAVAAVAYSITFTEVRRTLGNTNNVNVIVPANENRMVMPSRRQVLNSLDYRRSWSKNILNNKNKY